MANYRFELDGIEEMSELLNEIEAEFYKNLNKVLRDLAQKVILDARRLAPLDSGDLEASLDAGEVMTNLAEIYIDFGVVVSPEVESYAWVQHEGFRKTKSGKVVYLNPGEKTQSKGSHKGRYPGKKFLQNAIELNEDLIISQLQTALRFGGGL